MGAPSMQMQQQAWREVPEVVEYVESKEDPFYPVVLWIGDHIGYGSLLGCFIIGGIILFIIIFKKKIKQFIEILKAIWSVALSKKGNMDG